jgi:NAD(P)-dependent dehydrogenase (short-subunit alcohol dehydrogenase family)
VTALARSEWSADRLFDLSDRRALVTGASRGIGRAIALALAGAGADVVVHYARRESAAAETAADIDALGRRAVCIPADLSRPGAGAELADAALQAFGGIDILVLNAAEQVRQAFTEVDPGSFDLQINTGFRANWELARRLTPLMAERRWGRVITIGSVQQVRPNPELTVYGAVKCAQAHLARNLGRAFAGRGVAANNIAPGLVDTDRCEDLRSDPDRWHALVERIPVGRPAAPADIAGIVLALASPAGAYVTGADIPVDGGLGIP